MKATLPSELPRIGPWPIRAAFAAIVATFVASNLIAMREAKNVESQSRLIVSNMLTSIELVSRLEHDVAQKRLLLDEHTLETRSPAMERLEGQIAEIDADFASTSRAYEPIASLPGEHALWNDLRVEVAALQGPAGDLLTLSRANRDIDARKKMAELQPMLDAINQKTAALVHINHAEADATVAAVEAQRQTTLFLLSLMALAGSGLAVAVAIGVIRVVTSREAQLRSTSLLLEERNRELDAFAGRVAHDLRAPMTAIGLAAMRLSQRVPDEKGTSAVLRRNMARMEVLVRDLLTLSRAGSPAKDAVCDPAGVVASIAEEFAPQLQRENGTLRTSVDSARVTCSEGLLRQAVWNLTENAMRYHRPGVPPTIEIHGRIQGNTYRLRVSDNGIGMSPDDAPRVFEPFYRAERSRSKPGTGLGLSIVKRVVEASGGTVTIDTKTAPGTAFIVDLPMAGGDPHQAPRKIT